MMKLFLLIKQILVELFSSVILGMYQELRRNPVVLHEYDIREIGDGKNPITPNSFDELYDRYGGLRLDPHGGD